MKFKEAIEIANNHTITFGERVNANSFLQTLDYEKKEIGTINGEKVIRYSYENEIYYYYKNGFKTQGFFIGLINKLWNYSELFEVSKDVIDEFNIELDYCE